MSTAEGGPSIIRDGLVLYLDAANHKSYLGSGTIWNNISTNNVSGSLINGPTFSGNNNGSIVFDGGNDYVQVNNFKNTYSFNTPFTISFFLRTNTVTTRTSFISTYVGGFINDGVFMEIGENGTIRFAYRQLGVNVFDFSETSTILRTNTFYNIVGVYNGSNATIYVNTISTTPTASATTFFNINNTDLFIGRLDSTLGRYFNGNVYQTLIYNKALSLSEIQQNYNATKGRFNL
jgi:hypothetical protein